MGAILSKRVGCHHPDCSKKGKLVCPNCYKVAYCTAECAEADGLHRTLCGLDPVAVLGLLEAGANVSAASGTVNIQDDGDEQADVADVGVGLGPARQRRGEADDVRLRQSDDAESDADATQFRRNTPKRDRAAPARQEPTSDDDDAAETRDDAPGDGGASSSDDEAQPSSSPSGRNASPAVNRLGQPAKLNSSKRPMGMAAVLGSPTAPPITVGGRNLSRPLAQSKPPPIASAIYDDEGDADDVMAQVL